MRKAYIFITYLFCSIAGFSQDQQTIDSLQKAYDEATVDTTQMSILSELGDAYYASDPEKCLQINNQILGMVDKALPTYSGKAKEHLYLMQAACINNLGILAMDRGEIMKGLEYYKQSIPVFEKGGNLDFLAKSYNNIGFVYENQGDIERGLEYYFKSLKLRESINDHSGIGESYNNIAYMYQAQGDLDKSLETFKNALTHFEKVDDQQGIALVYNNLGNIYKRQHKAELAMDYFRKAAAIKSALGDHKSLSNAYLNIGDIFFKRKQSDSAKYYFDHALAEAQQAGNKSRIAAALQYLSDFYLETGNVDLALKYAKESFDLGMELGFPERIRDGYETLSNIYLKKGDYKNAYLNYKGYKEMSDSILSDETKQNAVKQQMKYSFDKREVEIEREKEKSELEHQAEVKQQRFIIYTSIAVILIVLVFSGFLYNRFRVTRKQKIIIEKQKNEVEEQKQIVEFQKEMVDEKNKEITDSINYAKRIQQAILPPARLLKSALPDSFVLYKPKDIVAGDFYWMEQKGDLVIFAAADCTGHGVPGAMVSVVCHNALNRSVREFGLTDPGKILDKTRQLVIETFEKSDQDVKDGMDISLCCYDRKTNVIKWSGANNPLWIIRENTLTEYKADKQPIGKFENAKEFTTHAIQMAKKDRLYIFTDGYADQFGGDKGKKFKYKQLQDLLISFSLSTPDEQKNILENTFESWKGPLEQVDDVCIIGVQL
ncbi:MAG: protein serine/threonine phosphatase [Bacteroidota bacterium]|jgi:serine phosphatase RsbU (regulator of sigma subunit)/TPR repeat protein|nr:protein serine/threonine phosphatase [Bacteroidota bacterium]